MYTDLPFSLQVASDLTKTPIIGEQEKERKEYMSIKKRASSDMEGHGEYATFVLKKVTVRLRESKKKITGNSGKERKKDE